jgi:putative cell wall-binding protein
VSISALLTALFVVLGLAVGAPAVATSSDPRPAVVEQQVGGIVKAADLSKFQAGNIISDAVFFDRGTMSAPQIQSFLESKVPRCQAGYTCLKDWYDTSRTTNADAMCGAYSGGIRERASTIIAKVAQACGINPQVILATLQKEQGLVLHTWPSEWRYTIAMGQGCPDTAACDTRYYGFFNQVYGAAWQFKRYANPPGTSNYFTWYAPGRTWNILWSPNPCGSAPVFVQNQATANLYYYTPYQPNAASLRAGYGEGDVCSTYGNRNFYQYFTDWFGSTQISATACTPPSDGQIVPASGEYAVNVAVLNGRKAPSTDCSDGVVSLGQGTILTKTGEYGTWWRVRMNGQIMWVAGQYLMPTPAVRYQTDRIAGANRYATAAAIAQQSNPSGAQTVYLASGETFPDAISASVSAAHESAALLLTASASLSPETATALSSLHPTRVILLGQANTVSTAVGDQVAALLGAGVSVERIAGDDRFATSLAIVTAGWTSAPTAYLAAGRGFADGVAASSVAAAQGFPLILVEGSAPTLRADAVDALKKLGVKSVVIAGDTKSISAGIASQLAGMGIAVDRKGGADRYATSLLLVSGLYPSAAPTVYLASGENYPDALTGSVLAGTKKAPLIISPSSCMVGATKDFLLSRGTVKLTLLGGTPSLSESVANSARC